MLVIAIITGSFSILFIHTSPVQALSGSDFKAGRIIDDAVFFNKDSMTVDQITNFINSKVTMCDRNRASSNPSYQPPWTCLKEYQENITTKQNNIGQFNTDGSPKSIAGGKSAAQIIWEVAQQYGINPQVLIVMLQKEQSLITDNWPWAVQYQKAMGYACPDTAPCDTQYYGFYNQVSSAAWQLKRYVNYPNNYNFKSGVTRYIQYSPNASCGGSNVFIENAATAALYNYTPYQPNPGALANLYGSADCGAYGNRNFWRMFNEWFGNSILIYSEIIKEGFYEGTLCQKLQQTQYKYKTYCNSPMSGDYNNDGYEDIAVVSIFPDKQSFNLWIFPGTSTGMGNPVFQQHFSSGQYWNISGIKMTSSDVNGDGFSDVVMYAANAYNGITTVQIMGSSSGLNTSPVIRLDRQYSPASGWQWTGIR
jgi:hypothetical protein